MSEKYDGIDLYVNPDTSVLRNLLGLETQSALDRAEAIFVGVQSERLIRNPIPESDSGPDFRYLLKIHKMLFADIYEWAGEIRQVDISKGSTRFANVNYI